MASVVEGNNRFALDLYGKVKGKPGNLFFSPGSISTALAMTYAGARGETAEQMAEVLHFSLPQDALHTAFAAMQATLAPGASEPGYRLSWPTGSGASRAITSCPTSWRSPATTTAPSWPRSTSPAHAEQARERINAWVEEQTQEQDQGPGPPRRPHAADPRWC